MKKATAHEVARAMRVLSARYTPEAIRAMSRSEYHQAVAAIVVELRG